LYEEQVDSRVKRLVVDWLVKHVEMLGVTPLLSVGSIETDEEMFRYMMRELLKLDRSAVCKQIEVETCPRPLLQVAVVLLSELGLRSALPKLQKCVEVGDAVVRSVALHGIGRSGEAAEPLVPLLLRTVELDSDKNVRLAAAKALQAMNTRKVYEAFEQKAHEVSLDPAVAHVLEELRAKFDPTGKTAPGCGGAGRLQDGREGYGEIRGKGQRPSGQGRHTRHCGGGHSGRSLLSVQAVDWTGVEDCPTKPDNRLFLGLRLTSAGYRFPRLGGRWFPN
jgi:hypothetical protein